MKIDVFTASRPKCKTCGASVATWRVIACDACVLAAMKAKHERMTREHEDKDL